MATIFATDDGGDPVPQKRFMGAPTPGPRRESRIANMVTMATPDLERSAELIRNGLKHVEGDGETPSRHMAKHFRDALVDVNRELIVRYIETGRKLQDGTR